MICLDIDNVKSSLCRETRNFSPEKSEQGRHLTFRQKQELRIDSLRKHLQEMFGEYGFAFLSAKSGNPKVILCVEYDQPVKKPNLKHIQDFLTELVPDLVKSGSVDLSRSAISTTFFDWNKKEMFADAMASLRPISVKKMTNQIEFSLGETKVDVTNTFVYMTLPEIPDQLKRFCDTELERRVMAALCCMSALAKPQHFSISTFILARTAGCCHRRAGEALRSFENKGIIRCVDDSFVIGKKAKTFAARGVLKKYLKGCINKASGKTKSNKLKRTIADGQWHQSLLNLAVGPFRHCLGRFIQYVKTIPGWDVGDRMQQAYSIVEWLIKKHPRLAYSLQIE